jgi:hypothetical protein
VNKELISQYPHCDSRVLHAPGECSVCDKHPEWQELRKMWGIAFTGKEPAEKSPFWRELPCPSDANRGKGGAHIWYGNRPSK